MEKGGAAAAVIGASETLVEEILKDYLACRNEYTPLFAAEKEQERRERERALFNGGEGGMGGGGVGGGDDAGGERGGNGGGVSSSGNGTLSNAGVAAANANSNSAAAAAAAITGGGNANPASSLMGSVTKEDPANSAAAAALSSASLASATNNGLPPWTIGHDEILANAVLDITAEAQPKSSPFESLSIQDHLRLAVVGEPFSGKSTLCKELGQKYGLRVLDVEQLVTAAIAAAAAFEARKAQRGIGGGIGGGVNEGGGGIGGGDTLIIPTPTPIPTSTLTSTSLHSNPNATPNLPTDEAANDEQQGEVIPPLEPTVVEKLGSEIQEILTVGGVLSDKTLVTLVVEAIKGDPILNAATSAAAAAAATTTTTTATSNLLLSPALRMQYSLQIAISNKADDKDESVFETVLRAEGENDDKTVAAAMAAATALEKMDSQVELCGICLSEVPDAKLDPCKHRICAGCALEFAKQLASKVKPMQCPFCRENVRGFRHANFQEKGGGEERGEEKGRGAEEEKSRRGGESGREREREREREDKTKHTLSSSSTSLASFATAGSLTIHNQLTNLQASNSNDNSVTAIDAAITTSSSSAMSYNDHVMGKKDSIGFNMAQTVMGVH